MSTWLPFCTVPLLRCNFSFFFFSMLDSPEEKSLYWKGRHSSALNCCADNCQGGHIHDTESTITPHTRFPANVCRLVLKLLELIEELMPSTETGYFCKRRPFLCGLSFLCFPLPGPVGLHVFIAAQ